MNLHITIASSFSLLSTLLLAAPAFAEETPAPAQAPASAPAPAAAPPASTLPAAAPPGYSLPPASGPGAYAPPMYGPYAQPPVILEEHRASPGLIVGGAVTTFVGVGTAVVGGLVYVFNTSVVCDSGFDGTGRCGGPAAPGIAMMIGGGLAMAGGVTMIVLGARKVLTPRSETSLFLRPTGADLRVTF
jgi:hypothetical protein